MACILIIEDTMALAQGLRSVLQIQGHRVVLAADGKSGLAAARTQMPDLVLLDLMLPDLHGFDILRTLRGEQLKMPVLVLTASGEADARQRSLESGADGFLPKPFQLAQLLTQVQDLLGDTPPAEPVAPGPPAKGSPR
jgi:DNA-binding response OmpR family regulator